MNPDLTSGSSRSRRSPFLDAAFAEYADRARTDHTQANLVTLGYLALNQLKHKACLEASISAKYMRAGWDDNYVLTVLHM